MKPEIEMLTTAVKDAWEASLPTIPYTPEINWGEVGLDSLKALEFVFRLEHALGFRIGFDFITADSSAADLISHLTDISTAKEDNARSRIFLIPGLFGDEPKLSLFRQALSRSLIFETLHLPGMEFSSRVHRSIRTTATRLIQDVVRIEPQGPLKLAGYSFGGLVAQEMARQLEASGRAVTLLVVLDGMLQPVLHEEGLAKVRTAGSGPRDRQKETWRSFLDRAIFALLYRSNLWEMSRRFMLSASPRHDWSWTHTRTEWLFIKLRNFAVLTWRGKSCVAQTLLVTSTDFPRYSSQRKWEKLCPNLRITPVNANHSRIFEPEPLAIIVDSMLNEMLDKR